MALEEIVLLASVESVGVGGTQHPFQGANYYFISVLKSYEERCRLIDNIVHDI
jgi:hypothetical protein